MTLQEFFAALTNSNAVVTVQSSDNTELVKVFASGYEQLLASLLAETVDKITISGNAAITIVLAGE